MEAIDDILESKILNRIQDPQSIIALTGAGISAPSGVPTFRGKGGLWEKHRAEELATPTAFSRDPQLVWAWYASRLETLAKIHPNAAHKALVELEDENLLRCVITQNVDPLHRKAGSKKIVKLHGDISTGRCTKCTYSEPITHSTIQKNKLPWCPKCNNLLRPDVVWFGESLNAQIINEAFNLASQCEMCLVIGTSAIVVPAAQLPLIAKSENDAILIEFNLEPTPLTPLSDLFVEGDVNKTLPQFAKWLIDLKTTEPTH